MSDDESARFVRWQSVTIEQLGMTSNLVLTLATGVLGFIGSVALDGKLNSKAAGEIALAAAASLFVSIAMAIALAVNRLLDFRETTQNSRTAVRSAADHTKTGALNEARTRNKTRGAHTWRLLWLQLGSFALGVLLAVAAFVVQVGWSE